jgi:hypothetical protein
VILTLEAAMSIKHLPAIAVAFILVTMVLADDKPNDQIQQKVDEQIAAWWPTADEKRLDQIGWVPDIRTAMRLAGEQNRPVFLFTMDGRVNLGRC